jgi:hypothetical protein
MRDEIKPNPHDQGTELTGELAAARIVAFSTLAD